MTAEIIPFSRYHCDCRYCRAVTTAWAKAGGPTQTSLDRFLAEHAWLLGPRMEPSTALAIIANQASPLERSRAKTILHQARRHLAPSSRPGDGPDAA
jgi:hypothetical protein